jgi:protein phosphatase 1 regulatory subunit 10
MNGSSTPTQQYNISSNLQQRPQYQYHHNLAINPAYVQGYPQVQPSVSNQQPQTLSPYVLHGSPVMDSLNPPSFYAGTPVTPSPPTPQLTPQARQEKFGTAIRPLLQPNQFTGAGAVLDLTDRIMALGMAEMETPLRLEILTKIRDNAGNHYFRAWAENEDAIEITREWLKAAAKGDDQLSETVMPLLHVRKQPVDDKFRLIRKIKQIIDRLPWSLESLRKAKLGKIILKLKEATVPGEL